MALQRIALAPLTSVLAAGYDDYLASLTIRIEGDFDHVETTGTLFAELMMATQLRHLAIHPRTGAFVEGSIKGAALHKRINDNWSSIDSMDEGKRILTDLANKIEELAETADVVGWSQTN